MLDARAHGRERAPTVRPTFRPGAWLRWSQMINTSSSITPIPITSTATAIGSYSSQCRPCMYMTRPPVFEFNDIRHASSDRKSLRLPYFLRFELLDERSDMRRYGGRESIVLGLEAVPNGQPNASFASGNQLALRSTIYPRPARGVGCRPDVRLEKIGCVDMPTNPVIDPVGRSNHGGELAS